MYRICLSQPRLEGAGLAELEARWRHFAQAAAASFFQDWTWVGCLARERYTDPVLVETFRDERLVALALFNRGSRGRGGETIYLHESTDPALDSTFIEHNGPLMLTQDAVLRQAIAAAVLTKAMNEPLAPGWARGRRIVLSGVGPETADAAILTGGVIGASSSRSAPYIDFGLIPSDQPFVGQLSRNTRHQLRRSNRLYAAAGPLVVTRAATAAEGLAYLAELIRLHDITWKARGKAGAFATSAVCRFYEALIADGVPRGEVDMLQVGTGEVVIGYLMNFRHRDHVLAYQSGFNYADAGPHQKPGLTSHHAAIEWYRAAGAALYDFLAGPDRYKLSLANAQRTLHWLTVAPPGRASVGARLRRILRF